MTESELSYFAYTTYGPYRDLSKEVDEVLRDYVITHGGTV